MIRVYRGSARITLLYSFLFFFSPNDIYIIKSYTIKYKYIVYYYKLIIHYNIINMLFVQNGIRSVIPPVGMHIHRVDHVPFEYYNNITIIMILS